MPVEPFTPANEKLDRPAQTTLPEQTMKELDPYHESVDDVSEPLNFPTHCLPQVMRDIVEDTSKSTMTPESMSALNAIGYLSASIGAGYLIESGVDKQLAPNLFILLAAPSGVGKSETARVIGREFNAFNEMKISGWINSERSKVQVDKDIAETSYKTASNERRKEDDSLVRDKLKDDMARYQQEINECEDKLGNDIGISVANVTSEKLAVAMKAQPGEALSSISSDAREVLEVVMGLYRKGSVGDQAIYLSTFSRERYAVARMNRAPVQLTTPTLSVLWSTQTDAIIKFAGDSASVASGMFPRFLMCNTRAEIQLHPETPHQADHVARANWNKIIKNALEGLRALGDTPTTIKTPASVTRIIHIFDNEIRTSARGNGINKDITSFVARVGENTWKLLLIFHTAEHGTDAHNQPLSDDTTRNAVEVSRWFFGELLAFLTEGRMDRQKQRFEKLARNLLDSDCKKTMGDLRKHNSFEDSEVRALAKLFPNKLKITEESTGGRPSTIVEYLLPKN